MRVTRSVERTCDAIPGALRERDRRVTEGPKGESEEATASVVGPGCRDPTSRAAHLATGRAERNSDRSPMTCGRAEGAPHGERVVMEAGDRGPLTTLQLGEHSKFCDRKVPNPCNVWGSGRPTLARATENTGPQRQVRL